MSAERGLSECFRVTNQRADGEAASRLGELSPGERAKLAGMADPTGVVSAYIDFTDGGQHRAEQGVRRAFAQLARDHPDGLSARTWRSLLHDALERLVDMVGLDTHGGERARVAFIPLTEGEGRLIRVASGLPDLITAAERPYVRPLLAAEDESARAAVIGVTDRGLTITEFWGNQPRAEWSLPFHESLMSRRLQGPSRARRVPGPRAEAQTDLVERRSDAHLDRAIGGAMPDLVELARRHHWRELAVGGDVRDSRKVAAALSDASIEALVHPQHVESLDERRAALAALARVRAGAQAERVEELLAASKGGRAVLGASATMEALERFQALSVVLGAPVQGSTTAIPRSPSLGIGDGDLHDPLNDIACTALSYEVPVATVAGDASRALPASAVGALLRTT